MDTPPLTHEVQIENTISTAEEIQKAFLEKKNFDPRIEIGEIARNHNGYSVFVGISKQFESCNADSILLDAIGQVRSKLNIGPLDFTLRKIDQ